MIIIASNLSPKCQQEVRGFHTNRFAFLIQSSSGYQTMNMRMNIQALIPRVQHGQESANIRPEALVRRKLFSQGTRIRRKEQVKSFLG